MKKLRIVTLIALSICIMLVGCSGRGSSQTSSNNPIVYTYETLTEYKGNRIVSNPDDYEYIMAGTVISISGYTGNDKYIKIPEKIDGYTVSNIAKDAFSSSTRKDFVCIVLPDTVQHILEEAFRGTTAEFVYLGKNIMTIEPNAFSGSKVETVVFPTEPRQDGRGLAIWDNAFSHCDNLETINLGRTTTVGDNAFSNCKNLTRIEMPMAREIGGNAFRGCVRLMETVAANNTLILPNVTHIGPQAFADIKTLGSVEAPSLEVIRRSAFDNSSVSMVTMPNIREIERFAFRNCERLLVEPTDYTSSLHDIQIVGGEMVIKPTTLMSTSLTHEIIVGERAFEGTPYEELFHPELKQSDSNSTNGDNSASGQGESQGEYDYEVLPNGGIRVTKYNGNDREIVIPDSIDGYTVVSIGNEDWDNGRGITFGENREWITSIVLPSTITEIWNYAFYQCGFSEFTIPNTVTSIGESAFTSCKNLVEISIPNSVATIGMSAFSNCDSLVRATLPDSITTIEAGTFFSCKSLVEVNIPTAVTVIGDSAFNRCDSLMEITLPNVVEIGDTAFQYCKSLESAFMPEVRIIGYATFSTCSSLTKVDMPLVEVIGSRAFRSCRSLVELNMPDNVQIGEDAFLSTPLEGVY